MVESRDRQPSFKDSVRALLRNPALERKLVPSGLLAEYDRVHPQDRSVTVGDAQVGTRLTGEGNEFDLGSTLGSGNVWAGGDRYDRVIMKGKGVNGADYAQIDNTGKITFVTSSGSIMMEDDIDTEVLDELSITVGKNFKLGRIRIYEVEKIVAIQAKGGPTEGLPFDPTLREFTAAMGRIDPKTTLMP